MNMSLQMEHNVVIFLDGDFDMAKANEFKNLVLEAMKRSKRITFDLSALSFIDSSGIGFLLYRCRKLIDQGYQLKFQHVSEEIRDLFDLLGFSYILREVVFQ